jgi:LPS sulfotransferase NodH
VFRRLLQLPRAPKKFVIIARARSGTTLIKRLMNQVPGVQCDAEKLSCAVFAPRAFVNNIARRKNIDAYGVKILTHQMLEVHRMGAGVPLFLQSLLEDGFTLIHLRRDTFDQALSLVTAQETNAYHMLDGDGHGVREVEIDPEQFALQFHHSQVLLDYEDLLFSRLPHLRLEYEEYLKDADYHQACIDKICAEIGVPSAPVQADLTPTSRRTVITNLQALREQADVVNACLLGRDNRGVVAR